MSLLHRLYFFNWTVMKKYVFVPTLLSLKVTSLAMYRNLSKIKCEKLSRSKFSLYNYMQFRTAGLQGQNTFST